MVINNKSFLIVESTRFFMFLIAISSYATSNMSNNSNPIQNNSFVSAQLLRKRAETDEPSLLRKRWSSSVVPEKTGILVYSEKSERKSKDKFDLEKIPTSLPTELDGCHFKNILGPQLAVHSTPFKSHVKLLDTTAILTANPVDCARTQQQMDAQGRYLKKPFKPLKAIALYFAAPENPQATDFTENIFGEAYFNLRRNGVEVVFMNGHTDEDSFLTQYEKMPWLAVSLKEGLQKHNEFKMVHPRIDTKLALLIVDYVGAVDCVQLFTRTGWDC